MQELDELHLQYVVLIYLNPLEDLDRLAPHIEGAIHRVPAFGEVGVKKVYNGAICYTPDGNPIVGPAWGLKNFWINEGHSFGITAAGGAGWQLAEWIIDGEPTIDMLGVEPWFNS